MAARWVSVPIGSVKPNPNNPRLIKDAKFRQLVQSVKDFPQMLELRPIVVDADGVVLGGNMRLKACKEAGLKQVPVIRADDLTPAQQREFVVKDNVGFGEWDWDELANEWDDDPLAEWGLDVPSFDVGEASLPAMPDGEHSGMQQITLTVTNDQADLIREAMEAAAAAGPFVDTGNENKNGNAIARVAEFALHGLR
jgi:hypothetical protein